MRGAIRVVRVAIRALRRRILCSALTTLGIVIGIAAVIALMEIGQGSATAVQQTIVNMGANNLLIQPGTSASGGVSSGGGSRLNLTPADAEAIASQCPTIVSVAPIVRARTQVVYGNRNWVPLYVYGTTPEYLEIRNWTDLQDGQVFTEHDVRAANRVCLLGQTVARELFPDEPPIGREVRIRNVSFRVIGLLSSKGATMLGLDQDDILLAPWTAIKFRVSGSSLSEVNQSSQVKGDPAQQINSLNRLYPGSQSDVYPLPSLAQMIDSPQPRRVPNVERILAQAVSPEEVPLATRQIKELLRERHHLKKGRQDDFTVRDMAETTNALASTAELMSGLLLGVAVISLVVGGVGIMNIMLVSVTERTREIGLRMAVGAKGRQILQQFLVESTILCLLGGTVGILLGRAGSMFASAILEWPTEPSPMAVIAALVVSVTIGLVFGFYPAWKAARLDPIEALRYE